MKPRLLDLFCGAGGASAGYSRAGFDVIGVDINPQPLCFVAEPSLQVGNPLPARNGSGIAVPYGVAIGLVIATSLGWPFVAAFSLVAGPLLGASIARRDSRLGGSAESHVPKDVV